MITNFGKSRIALMLGGSETNYPSYFAIGSGSGLVSVTDTTLIHEEDRQAITSATYPATQKVTFQGDWNSVELSGLSLSEFGVLTSGGALTGSIWSRTNLPNITFDGSIELQIIENLEVF